VIPYLVKLFSVHVGALCLFFVDKNTLPNQGFSICLFNNTSIFLVPFDTETCLVHIAVLFVKVKKCSNEGYSLEEK